MEVLSPTINMFCLGQHYINFIKDFTYYLDQEMEAYKAEEYIGETLGLEQFMPKGRIAQDITWYFNHDTDADVAVKTWNEKKKRVNRNNIAAIMTLHSDKEAYLFDELQMEKKLGIYYKNLGVRSVICCEDWEKKEIRKAYSFNWPAYVNRYLLNISGMVGRVDRIRFLLGEEGYLRY